MSQADRAEVLEALCRHRITPGEARRLLEAAAGRAPSDQVPATSARAAEPGTGPVAVVGMSGRYAAAGDLDAYWRMLVDGADGVRPLPPRFGGADLEDLVLPRIGYLDDVEMFDPTYFQIPHAEARSMDPQHRMFLEECAAAFQSAGYSRARLAGSRCGVYLGLANGDYLLMGDRAGAAEPSVTSSSNAVAAGRVSYFYDLTGPALTIDTACSSSLVAVHLAVTALRSGEIDMAVAGGAATYLSRDGLVQMADAGMLSPTGACHALSDDADGFVPGEGAGAVVLKRLADALRDGDPVRALIIGSGINQDGRTNGITARSLASQRALAEEIYEREPIDPRTVSYAEMHGTGTILGDPVELTALTGAFRRWTPDKGFCSVGSVKSNLGHTSAAAGVAGLHKVVMCLEHQELVPTLHFSAPNRHLDLAGSPFTVGTRHRRWEGESPRRAVLSSFGFSGTNAHLVVQERVGQPGRPAVEDLPVVLVVSAHSQEQVHLYAQRLVTALEADPDLAAADVALTLQRGRDALPERAAAVAHDRSKMVSLMRQLAASGEGWYRGRARRSRDAAVCAADGLDVVAQAWASGREVDWATLPQTSSGRTVVLPTYPFERVPLWFKGSPQAPGTGRGDGRTRVSIASGDWRVDQHRIEGVPVLPATASAEILLRWASEYRGGSVPAALVDLRWIHPLEVREDHLELDVQRADDGQLTILAGSQACVHARAARAGAERSVDLASVSSLPVVTAPAARAAVAYGPRYRVLQELRAEGRQATGTLVPPQDPQDSAWAGVLDAAWQCVGPLLPVGDPCLPFAAERLEIWGEVQQARHVVATRRAGESWCFDVDVTAGDGTVLASTSGLVLAPAGGTGVLAVARRWSPDTASSPQPAGRLRVHIAGEAERLRPVLEDVVDLSSRAQDSDAVVIVLPTTSADARGTEELFDCCQEVIRPLLADGARETRVLLVDLACGSSPAAAAMAGYVATLRLESSLVVSMLQIRATEDLARHVLEEAARTDPLVRVTGGQRHVAVMAEVGLPGQAGPSTETALVAGGSSGVGALVAQAVVAAGGRAAVLSRSGAPDPLPAWAEAAGDNVLYLAADLAAESDVVRAVDHVHRTWGAIDALYHCAGVLDDAMLRSTTSDQVSRVLAPKARGFDVVDQVLCEEPLERVVLFSSLSAWLGNPGQAAYCVANAYLDEAAVRRERQREAGERQGRTVSIGWPYWAEGGMTISDDAVDALRRDLGMVPLDTATGLSLISQALASSEPAIACGQGSVPVMRRAMLQHQPAARSQERPGSGPRELALAAAGCVRQAVSEATGTPPERVRLDDTFEDLGMDSIVIMTATRVLERDFGPLPKTLFLEHRSIDELAVTLAGTHPDTCASLAQAQEPVLGPEASSERPTGPEPAAGPSVLPAGGRAGAQDPGAASGRGAWRSSA